MRPERPSIVPNPVMNISSPKRKNSLNDSDENKFKGPTRHLTSNNIQISKDDSNTLPSKMPERKLMISEE